MIRSRETYKDYYNDFYRKGDFHHYPEHVNLAYIGGLLRRFGVREGSKILDIGCGTGVQLSVLKYLGMEAFGLELSIEGLRFARARNPNFQLVNGDAFQLPFPCSIFHAVCSFGSVLNYTDDAATKAILMEMLRVTASGGWLLIVTMSDNSGKEKGGYRQRTNAELDEILASIPARTRTLIRTAPRLSAFVPDFAFHPIFSMMLRRAFGYRRTIILAFQKQ